MATRRMMKRSALVMGMMAAGVMMADAWIIIPSKRVMVAGRGGRIVHERRLPCSATTDGATASATTDTRRDGSDEGGQPAVVEEGGELESTRVPATVPPPRSISKPGYRAPPELVTWEPFTYAQPAVRRAAVRDYVGGVLEKGVKLPSLRLVLIGGVACGKGTIAPMLSQAFACRVIGVGQLLRGEVRAERPRGLLAYDKMAAGELLDDSLVLGMLQDRLTSSTDIIRNGWLLDGFPRTQTQAKALLSAEWDSLRPDAVILIDRPDELIKEFSLGRCCDSTTGQTYHPVYAPAPPEVHPRLVWRLDDSTEVLTKRVTEHRASCEGIVDTFERAGVPLRRFDNARSELETFKDIAAFVEEVAASKIGNQVQKLLKERRALDTQQGWAEGGLFGAFGAYAAPLFQSDQLSTAADLYPDAANALAVGVSDEREADIDMFCEPSEDEGECLVRYDDEFGGSELKGSLLAAVRQCNTYDQADYLPVLVGDEQVGWVNEETLNALAPQLAEGYMCELADLTAMPRKFNGIPKGAVESKSSTEPWEESTGSGSGSESGLGSGSGSGVRMVGLGSKSARGASTAVRLAPGANSMEARTTVVAELVQYLVGDGHIPAAKVRDELQDVHPLSQGFVIEGSITPSLRLERAAMIYFGIPSYGVHVNGWVRDPDRPDDARPWGMWVAKRSMSKATYAGLLDQVVAGGQPSGITFVDNVRKECEEEASFPPEVISQVRQTGLISYRYTTRKGLSTKILATYDLEVPQGLLPICSDGEVDEFRLLSISEVLRSVREELPLWKPNSAMVVVDFAIRHGFIDFDEPGYMEIAHLLRKGAL